MRRTRNLIVTVVLALGLVAVGCSAVDDDPLVISSPDSSEVDRGTSGNAPATSNPTTLDPTTPDPTTLDPTTPNPVAPTPADFVACSGTGGDYPPDTIVAFIALCERSDGFDLEPVFRAGPEDTAGSVSQRLEQRVEQLVDGTTGSEADLGLFVGFDSVEEAADVDVVAGVDGADVATIEFLFDGETWDPGPRASASAQLLSFLDPLLATAFVDPEIDGVDLSGLCWGELGCDAGVTTRAQWNSMLFTNYGLLTHEYCSVTETALRPGDCTVAGQLSGATVTARVVDVADDDTLNLRAGPGIDHPVVVELPPAAVVEVAEAAAAAPDGGVWRLVDGGDGLGAGWANNAFLSLSRTEAESIVDAFVTFADDRSDESFGALPLAAEVQLGLGPDLLRSVEADDLREPEAWTIDQEYFRAYVGPFSPLDQLASLDLYEVSEGAHPHCAAGPVAAPSGFDDLDRISGQRHSDLITSCLEWATVDFFLDPEGRVDAITLDLWEP